MRHFLFLVSSYLLITGYLAGSVKEAAQTLSTPTVTRLIQLEVEQSTPKEEKKEEKKEEEKKEPPEPWFDGTFLALYGDNTNPGRLELTPAIQLSKVYGIYNGESHLVSDLNDHFLIGTLLAEWGITDNIDFTLILTESYAYSHEGNALNFGDTQTQWGFQIMKDEPKKCIPSIRVLAAINFPTGKFDRLNPDLVGIDVTGSGAYSTAIILVAAKTLCRRSRHPSRWNLNLFAINFYTVHTHGLSVYGGGPGVVGEARPGQRFIANLAYEYKFNKNWGWGIDLHFEHQNSSSFKTIKGTSIFEGLPSIETYSLAPEIEYNFSEDFAIEGGCWFSVYGRNTIAFYNYFFSLSYVF